MTTRGEGQSIDRAVLRKRLAEIFPQRRRRPGRGTFVMQGGKLVPVAEASRSEIRKRDSTRFRSNAMGCHPNQVKDFTRKFGKYGCSFDPKTGDAYFKNRHAKLATMKARGMVDWDEVRGGPSRPEAVKEEPASRMPSQAELTRRSGAVRVAMERARRAR